MSLDHRLTRLRQLSRALLPCVFLAVTGCSYNVDSTKTYDSSGVARLYDYPNNRGYENLGLHAWGFYRIGFAEPTLARVWDSLSEKVRDLGGNACIVRHEEVGNISARTIEVTCEVLRVSKAR